jgi:HlyD family secretion protein
VWIDVVKRGPMLLDVRGLGTLVPEESRIIPATRDGLVERLNVNVGDIVTAGTILMELSNPDFQQTLIDAELQLRAAEADLANTRATLQSRLLDQQTALANAEVLARRAQLQLDAEQELARDGLVSELQLNLTKVDAENRASQSEMEKRRVDISARSAEAQIAAQEARVEQFRAALELKKSQIEQLRVRAGVSGVVQQIPVQYGQRVPVGTILAKVAEPGRLKAELKIPETQVKDIVIGQVASIDTRNGIIPGRVIRIDPAATQGTVTVDVQLEGELPRGARPDLSVDGTVEIMRLNEVLFVGRPSYGQADSTISMFKLMPDNEAVRVPVRLGRSAVNVIEIVEGLEEGDQVILSDMSTWDSVDRVRLN